MKIKIKKKLLKENIQELFATIRQLINAGQYDRAYAQIMVQINEDDPKHKMAIDYLVRHSEDDSYEDKLDDYSSDHKKLIAYAFLEYNYDFDDFVEEYVMGVFDSPEEYIKAIDEEMVEVSLEGLPGNLGYYVTFDWARWARDREWNGEFSSWELDDVPGVLIVSPA